ncbi:MAG: ABC transporter ATP-binding protein [Mariprofundaceae bacterium]
MSVLSVENLEKSFRRGGLWGRKSPDIRAVDRVSFELDGGETLAIVGESGSGKSTTARLVLRLIEPDAGQIRLLDQDITSMQGKALRSVRRHMQMVFQDPFAPLNPRMKIRETVGEGLRVHAPELNKSQRLEKVADVLAKCGIGEVALNRYPHQFSGGQRQRIGIARSLAVSPKLLVLDEPVSALDVSIQAQILNLLRQLQSEQNLAYLFISHDLSVVKQVADRAAVMFSGKVVEAGRVEDVFSRPKHPYTRALLEARPVNHPKQRDSSADMPAQDIEAVAIGGCPYRLRCSQAKVDCKDYVGDLFDGAHKVACIHPLN